jgi:hypothetical protein
MLFPLIRQIPAKPATISAIVGPFQECDTSASEPALDKDASRDLSRKRGSEKNLKKPFGRMSGVGVAHWL